MIYGLGDEISAHSQISFIDKISTHSRRQDFLPSVAEIYHNFVLFTRRLCVGPTEK